MINGTIYKITCLVNDKCYIGQTYQSVESRWRDHIKGRGSKLLYNDVKKYGVEMFKFEKLHKGITSYEFLNILEKILIVAHDAVRTGYNARYGGQDEYKRCQAWEHTKEICRLYTEELVSMDKLAKKFDTTKTTILAVLEVNGIKRRDKSYAWEHSKIIYDMYTRQNKPIKEIAGVFDVADATISRILKSSGAKVKRGGRKKSELWEHADKICSLYIDDLKSTLEIAKLYKTNAMAIKRILDNKGIKTRRAVRNNKPTPNQIILDI